MAEAIVKIKCWGDALGLCLPASVAKAANLHADQRVRLSVEDGRMILTPLPDLPLTLEQRLARFDPAKHGGEI